MRVGDALKRSLFGIVRQSRLMPELGDGWRFAGHALTDLFRTRSAIGSAIDAALAATVAIDVDFGQAWNAVGQTVPNPHRDALKSGCAQTFDLV